MSRYAFFVRYPLQEVAGMLRSPMDGRSNNVEGSSAMGQARLPQNDSALMKFQGRIDMVKNKSHAVDRLLDVLVEVRYEKELATDVNVDFTRDKVCAMLEDFYLTGGVVGGEFASGVFSSFVAQDLHVLSAEMHDLRERNVELEEENARLTEMRSDMIEFKVARAAFWMIKTGAYVLRFAFRVLQHSVGIDIIQRHIKSHIKGHVNGHIGYIGEIKSRHTPAGLWPAISHFFRNEIFSYLDVSQSSRLCRVSSDWKSSLLRIAKLNKGLIFFPDYPVADLFASEAKKQHIDGVLKLRAEQPFDELLVIEANTVHRVVFFPRKGRAHISMVYRSSPVFRSLVNTSQPVVAISFYGDTEYAADCNTVFQCLLARFDSVKLHKHRMRFGLDAPSTILDGYQEVNTWNDWLRGRLYWTFIPPKRVTVCLDKSFLSESNSDHSVTVLFNKLDKTGAIWPNPKVQTQWLERVMGTVPDEIAAECRKKDSDFCNLPRVISMKSTGLWKSGITSIKLTWNNRELDSLDCAFLSRLLLCICEYEGKPCEFEIEKPPYEINHRLTSITSSLWGDWFRYVHRRPDAENQ